MASPTPSKFPPWLQALIFAAVAQAIAEIDRFMKRRARRASKTYEHQKDKG